MTVEQKLVEHLKSNGMAMLVDDAEALQDLARQAIRQALIEPRKVAAGRYGNETLPSISVAAANETAAKAANAVMEAEVERLKSDPEFVQQFRKAMAELMPGVLMNQMQSLFSSVAQQASMEAVNQLQQMIRNGTLKQMLLT